MTNSRFSQSCDTRLQLIDGDSLLSEQDKVCSDHDRSRCHLADGEYLHEAIKSNVETGRTKFKANIIIIIIIIIITTDSNTLFKF